MPASGRAAAVLDFGRMLPRDRRAEVIRDSKKKDAAAEREEADEAPAWLHVTMSEERGGAAPPPRIAVGEFQDERDRSRSHRLLVLRRACHGARARSPLTCADFAGSQFRLWTSETSQRLSGCCPHPIPTSYKPDAHLSLSCKPDAHLPPSYKPDAHVWAWE